MLTRIGHRKLTDSFRPQTIAGSAAVFLFMCLAAACGACAGSPSPAQADASSSAAAPSSGTGAVPATVPAAPGWDALAEVVLAKSDRLHACLVMVDGQTVFEAYPWPVRADDRHKLNSVTKSVVSLLVGIAVGEGRIPSIDSSLASWFPEATAGWPADKKAITLRHVLTMTEGLSWSEEGSYSGPADSYTAMFSSPDPTRYVLDRPLAGKPGERFYYNSGDSQLLSAVIQRATGMTARDYAREKLFGPLGIDDVFWARDRTGATMGPSGLQLRARDLARIGQLCLARGAWEGRQVVPAAWIDESTVRAVASPNGLAGQHGYGFHWWMNPSGGYSGRGYGGQYLIVDPERKVVAVFFGASFDNDFYLPERVMADLIVPAAESAAASGPAASGGASRAALRDIVARIETAPSPSAPAPLPATATAISGKTIRLDDDSTWSFSFPSATEALASMGTGGEPGTFPVGLDGIWRRGELGQAFGPAPPNPVFARGAWEDEDALRVEIRQTWDNYTYVFRFRFLPDGSVEERCDVPELGQEIERLRGRFE